VVGFMHRKKIFVISNPPKFYHFIMPYKTEVHKCNSGVRFLTNNENWDNLHWCVEVVRVRVSVVLPQITRRAKQIAGAERNVRGERLSVNLI